jgi:prophage regulatory protein
MAAMESPTRDEIAECVSPYVAEKHLRRRDVQHITGLARSTIYNLMARREFPRPVKLTGKAVGWPESKIAEWLADRQTS